MNSKDSFIGQMAAIFLNFRDNMKIYHWQTTSYARHKASCELIESLDEKTDKFIEVIQGCRKSLLIITSKFEKFNLDNQSDDSAYELLVNFKLWLENVLPKYILENEIELLNIKDDILADVDKTIYLFSFK